MVTILLQKSGNIGKILITPSQVNTVLIAVKNGSACLLALKTVCLHLFIWLLCMLTETANWLLQRCDGRDIKSSSCIPEIMSSSLVRQSIDMQKNVCAMFWCVL